MKNRISKILENIAFITIVMLMIFARPLTGFYLFGFRLGELLVGFGILLAFLLIVNYLVNNEYKHKELNGYFLILLFLFFISLFFNTGNILNLYTYKSSSYIWTIPYLFLGIYFFNLINRKYFQYVFVAIPILIYIFGTINYPIIFINFFVENSDKFEFHKASDILLVVLTGLIVARTKLLNKKKYAIYFFSITGLFIPLFLYMSKGSLLAFIFFFLFEIVLNFKFLKTNIKQFILSIVIGSLFFSFSTLNIWGDFSFTKPQSLFGLLDNSSELTIAEKFVDLYKNKAIDFEHPDKLIYFFDGRVYSSDVTTNWRLQIWQDVIHDLTIKNQIFFGYGYNEIIPAMDDVERRGTDGTNENVHNYFINILARGGLLQLSFFIFAYYQVIKRYFKNKEKFFASQYLISILIVSFFDSSMESVRFPIIFYTIAGCFLYNNHKKNPKN